MNVAITRARERMVVISSITAADLPADSSNEGVVLLRRYLDFAERGTEALTATPVPTGFPAESPFEESVARELTRRGYQVHRQVGCSGYRIDLAIVDPEHSGRYLLGIECDGKMYHSSPTARERDRIRQEILEGLGWRLVRIWSYEWIRNRERQIERIEQALKSPRTSAAESSQPKGARESDLDTPLVEVKSQESRPGADGHAPSEEPRAAPSRDRGTTATPSPARTDGRRTDSRNAVPSQYVTLATGSRTNPKNGGSQDRGDWIPPFDNRVVPYQTASLGKPRSTFENVADAELADLVRRIVEQEAPVHQETIIDRLREFWQIERVGSRMRERIERATRRAATARGFRETQGFWWTPHAPTDPALLKVRVPGDGGQARLIQRIPAEEIAAAAYICLENGVSLPVADLVRGTAQRLGYTRTGKEIQAAIQGALPLLVKAGRARREGDRYVLVQ